MQSRSNHANQLQTEPRPIAGRLALSLAFPLALAAALTLTMAPASQAEEAQPQATDTIGNVDFQVACDPAVQPDFDRALALMHHMMYQQARAAFEKITEADPECAMAHWGIATTLFQPLWPTRPSPEDLAQGWQHINTAEQLVEDERESALVAATKAFFKDPDSEDYWPRIQRWATAMETAYQAHPDDADTAALYALSRIALASRAENRAPLHDEAESVLRKVHEDTPTHPGAIHYSIHSTDVDGRAENALDMVRVYGRIAPDVPHSLHMPSHIYVRLGEWPEVIDWNRRSADAALQSAKEGAKEGAKEIGEENPVSHHYIHGLDYLLYAYLQQGRDDQGKDVLEEAQAIPRHQASFVSAYHAAAMPARYAVERRDWEQALALEPRTPEYLPWDQANWPEGLTWLARGLGGVQTGNLEAARESEKRLEALHEQAVDAGEKNFATYIEVDRRILAGWNAWAENEPDQAVTLLRSAAELERTVEKDPTSPGSLLPPNEALGDLLMRLQQPAQALAAYQQSEKVWPGRYNTLLGAARAALAAENPDAARDHYRQLLDIAGDSSRPGITEAREFLSAYSARLSSTHRNHRYGPLGGSE